MTDNMSLELCETFVAEGMDYIDELEPQFIELSQAIAKGDVEASQHLMNHIFRLIHTLKGSAGSLGFKNIAGLAHKAENLLDSIRHHRIDLTEHRLDLLTRSLDVFRNLLGILQQHHSDESADDLITDLVAELDLANAENRVQATIAIPPAVEMSSGFFVFEDETPVPAPGIKVNAVMRLAFVQEGEENLGKVELCLLGLAEQSPPDRAASIAEALRILHSFKGNCGFMQLHDMEALVHAMETVLQDAEKGNGDEGSDELLRANDSLKTALGLVALDTYAGIPSLAQLLSLLGIASEAKSIRTAKNQDVPKASALVAVKATLEQVRSAAPASASRSDVRVDLKKLDALINLVGELVVAEAMVTGWVKSKGIEDESLDRAVHHLKRTTLNLQDVAMSVRMVPVNQTFKKMVRLVHDTSSRLGKKVRLNLLGEETEVDKTVIEQIADPLVHCVRNSIDHGLETPEERRKAGKDETGTITLEAKHEGGEVWIVIQDDGKGLNREKILDRARQRGLFPLDKEHALSDEDIYNFIFEPGFSTAEQVTDVSGRGVGMDVVKKNIEKVKGKIRIESESGVGSRVVFQIPLTLAIIDGMMIRVGQSKYTIPLLSIQESIRVPVGNITTGPDGLEMIDVRSDFIPIVRLDDLMTRNRCPEKVGDCVVVVVEVNNRSIALLVDEIMGQQQTVIKALPAIYRHSKNVSGCSILANGDVSLILDVAGIAASLNHDYESLMSSAA